MDLGYYQFTGEDYKKLIDIDTRWGIHIREGKIYPVTKIGNDTRNIQSELQEISIIIDCSVEYGYSGFVPLEEYED